MGYQSFKELRVWQEAKSLAVEAYKITAKGELAKDYGLKDQMQRSAVSIASNIAEGYERNSDKEFIRFLMIAKGSVAELKTQLEIAKEIGFVDQKDYDASDNRCNMIGAMLTKLIKARKGDTESQ
jgi:four helix bundle protein